MTVFEQLSSNQVAMAVAAALERAIGPDTILTVGMPKTLRPDATSLPANPRVAVAGLTAGLSGHVAIAASEALAQVLEAGAPDEEMLTALAPAFASVVAEIAVVSAGLVAGDPRELVFADYQAGLPNDGSYLVYPLLDGAERVAALVIHVGSVDAATAAPGEPVEPAAARAAAPIPRHEFGALPDTSAISLVDARPLSLLHDVEMGVTAELGRRRMTVRDLLSLTPGAVIELDRAAGSPVDVLVNGTLIARGEVVVIDEEFGIRVSEIVAGVEAGAR